MDTEEYNIELWGPLVESALIDEGDLENQNQTNQTNQDLKLYVRIVDQYGKNVSGILNYSIDESKNWTTVPMELVNGIPSNGTFRGLVSDPEQDSVIDYILLFEDELGYTGSEDSITEEEGQEGEEKRIFSNSSSPPGRTPPVIDANSIIHGHIEPNKPVVVRANIVDDDYDVENATLRYTVREFPNGSIIDQERRSRNIISVPMEIVDDENYTRVQYQGLIPPL